MDEVVPEQRQNVCYAKLFPNISIVLEQIHIFKSSVVAELMTGQATQLHTILTAASPAFKTIPNLPVPFSPHPLPAMRVWLMGMKPGILFNLLKPCPEPSIDSTRLATSTYFILI